MKEIANRLNGLNGSILRKIETEFSVFKESNPNLGSEIDKMYRRIRKGILDDIGSFNRFIQSSDNADD